MKNYEPSKKCSELIEEAPLLKLPDRPHAQRVIIEEQYREDMYQLDQHYQEEQFKVHKLYKDAMLDNNKEIESLKKGQEKQCVSFYDAQKRYKQEKLELLREIQKHFCVIHSGEEGTNSYIQFDPLTLDKYIENKIKELEGK